MPTFESKSITPREEFSRVRRVNEALYTNGHDSTNHLVRNACF